MPAAQPPPRAGRRTSMCVPCRCTGSSCPCSRRRVRQAHHESVMRSANAGVSQVGWSGDRLWNVKYVRQGNALDWAV